jgi:hypothetical protein
MDTRHPVQARTSRQRASFLRTQVTLALLVATAAIPLLVLAALLPRPFVLPVLSLAALAAAGAIALAALWYGAARHTAHITPWDAVGALAFIGFAAGMLSEPEQAALLFGDMQTTR